MARKRYIVEIGTGVDLHGGNVTKAAVKAVKNAISHSCLCGLYDILGVSSPGQMHVEVKIACPHPEKIDAQEVLKAVPLGSAGLEVVAGGLSVHGLAVPQLGEGDTIVAAVAAVTVYVDTGA